MRRVFRLAAGLCVSWLASGCTSVELEPVRFYRLGPAIVPTGDRPPTKVLRIDDFTVAPHLAGDRLVAVIGRHRLAPYRNDLWAAPLERLVTDAVIRGLMRSQRFVAVLGNRDAGRADLSLSGRVLNFEEEGDGGSFKGFVQIAYVLREERSGRLLGQGSLAEKVAAPSDGPEYAVWSLSEALGKVLTRLAAIAERGADVSAARAPPGK